MKLFKTGPRLINLLTLARRIRPAWVVWGLMLSYAAYFSAYKLCQHAAFQTYGYDFSYFLQPLWNTLHGDFLRLSLRPTIETNYSFFQYHFTPGILLLVPLYALWPSPAALLILQSVVVASSAGAVFRMTETHLQNAWLGAGYAAVYLLFPALQSAIQFDFRLSTLAAALLAWAWYAAQRRSWLWFGVCAAVVMSFREELALSVFMMGLLLAWPRATRRAGLCTMAGAALWFGVVLWMIFPASQMTNFRDALPWVMGWGKTPDAATGSVLAQPARVLAVITQPEKIMYLLLLFAPVGYLAWLAPLTMAPIWPILAINLLSAWRPFYSPTMFHYSASVAPFAVLAAAVGSGRLASFLARCTKFSRGFLLALCLGAILLMSVGYHLNLTFMPFSPKFYWPPVGAHQQLGETILQQIPAEAVVATQNNLAPHLSHRRTLYIIPHVGDAEYIFLDLTVTPWLDVDAKDADAVNQIIQQCLTDPAYIRVVDQDGYVLLRRIK